MMLKKITQDPRIKNSLWMLIEKSISIFGLIFIVSAVAKYTGPSIYGEISLAASIFIVLKTFSQFGLDQIYFKYVSQKKPYYSLFLIKANQLISLVYISLSFFVLILSYFFASYTGFYFILATCIAYYFNSIDLLNAFYEGALLSKINVISNVVGLLFSLLCRWFIVYNGLDYIYLTIPIFLMTFIPFLMKLIVYRKKFKEKNKINVENNSKVKKYIPYFLGVGFPLMLSIITTTVNGQISNFLLGYLENTKSVGIFSVAFILAGAWCVVPTTLIMSYMTSIYKINNNQYSEYYSMASKILLNIFLLSLAIICILYLSSSYFITWLYGFGYYNSIVIFDILIFFQLLWVLNFYFSRIIIKFNGYRFLAIKSISMLMLNIIISFVLIKKISIIGAALSLVIVEFISLLINFSFKPAKLKNVIYEIIGTNKS